MQIELQPNSKILKQGDNTYIVKGTYPMHTFMNKGVLDKTKLGIWVKWMKADHVVAYDEEYYVCERIEDAQEV